MFQRWDLERTWKKPEEVFISHLKEKADDCLDVAKLLMELIGNSEIVFKSNNPIKVSLQS